MARETIQSRENNSLFINLSHGNKKLKSNDKVAFLIWNLPAIMTCPYATENCKRYCYARKAEKTVSGLLKVKTGSFRNIQTGKFRRQDDLYNRYRINEKKQQDKENSFPHP